MDVVVSVLVGLLLFSLFGWISFFLFNLVTGILNVAALALARGTRRLFGVSAGWAAGASAAALIGEFAKVTAMGLFGLSVFWYFVVLPHGAIVADASAGLAGLVAFVIWMPSMFFFGLFSEEMSM